MNYPNTSLLLFPWEGTVVYIISLLFSGILSWNAKILWDHKTQSSSQWKHAPLRSISSLGCSEPSLAVVCRTVAVVAQVQSRWASWESLGISRTAEKRRCLPCRSAYSLAVTPLLLILLLQFSPHCDSCLPILWGFPLWSLLFYIETTFPAFKSSTEA